MKKIDELVKRVEFFERLAVYGDRKSFLTRLAQEANYSPNPNIAPPSNAPNASYGPQTTKEVTIVGNRPIDPKVQDLLNKILVPAGKILPLATDGLIGPETQKALSLFKQLSGKPASPAAIAQYYKETNAPAAATAHEPGAPVAPQGSGLAGVGNTQSTPGAGSAGSERPVPGPKA